MRAIFRIALRNTYRHRRRSLSVVLAVALGFTALSLLHGFGASLREIFQHQARHQLMHGDLLVKKAIPPNTPLGRIPHFRLSRSDQRLVEHVLHEHRHAVTGYMRKLFIGGLATTGPATTYFFGMGYDVARGTALRGREWQRDTYAGEPLQEKSPAQVVMARQLATILGCDGGPGPTVQAARAGAPSQPLRCEHDALELRALSAQGRLSAVTVGISGLFETGTRELGRKYLMTDLATAQSLFDTDEINGYSIAVANPAYVPVLREALSRASDRAGAGLRVKPWQEFAEGAFYRALILDALAENEEAQLLGRASRSVVLRLAVLRGIEQLEAQRAAAPRSRAASPKRAKRGGSSL
jgi:hypothetical protein